MCCLTRAKYVIDKEFLAMKSKRTLSVVMFVLMNLASAEVAVANGLAQDVGGTSSASSQSEPREKWGLRTGDTKLQVGVSSDQKLCIYELSGPDGWNWTSV